MILKAKAKFLSYMNIATACFIVAYIQLTLHISIVATIAHVLLTLAKEKPVDDVKSMGKAINVLLMGQLVFPLALLMTKFTITLIVGLHTKSRIRIISYLICATLVLILTAIALILLNYVMNQQLPCDLVLTLTTPYALLIYLLRKYLKQLDTIDVKLLKETV